MASGGGWVTRMPAAIWGLETSPHSWPPGRGEGLETEFSCDLLVIYSIMPEYWNLHRNPPMVESGELLGPATGQGVGRVWCLERGPSPSLARASVPSGCSESLPVLGTSSRKEISCLLTCHELFQQSIKPEDWESPTLRPRLETGIRRGVSCAAVPLTRGPGQAPR